MDNENKENYNLKQTEGTSKFNPKHNQQKSIKVGEMPQNHNVAPPSNEESEVQKFYNDSLEYTTLPLPSKGILYPEYNGQKISHVRVYDLTLMDERTLTDPVLAQKEETINVLLREKVEFMTDDGLTPINNPPITVDDLLFGDRMTIMIMLRVSLDSMYKYSVKDPKTGEIINGKIDLTTLKTKELEVMPNENGEFKYMLPKSKKAVCFKLLTARDEKLIDQRDKAEMKATGSKLSNKILYRFQHMIMQIDDTRDKSLIAQFCKTMPLKDSRHLNAYINAIAPTVDLTVNIQSEEGRVISRFLPITSELLFPTIELSDLYSG